MEIAHRSVIRSVGFERV